MLLVIVTILPNYGKQYRLHYWVSIYGAASTTGNNKKEKKGVLDIFLNIQIHAYILLYTHTHIYIHTQFSTTHEYTKTIELEMITTATIASTVEWAKTKNNNNNLR